MGIYIKGAFGAFSGKVENYPQPRSAWPPSLFPSKRIIWKPRSSTKTPQTGDVFAIYYPNLKRIGHAGFIDEWDDKMVVTVKGNTSDGQQAESVYRKRRPTSSLYAVANWF